MIRLFLYLGLFILFSIVLLFSFVSIYFQFLDRWAWQLRGFVLEKYGTTVTSEVVKCVKQDDPHYDEYHEYVIDYVYKVNGDRKRGRDKFSINTMHVGYANVGMMLDTPKLVTTVKDLESTFQPGSTVHLKYVPGLPFLRKIEYEKHPNQLIDQQILAEYAKQSER